MVRFLLIIAFICASDGQAASAQSLIELNSGARTSLAALLEAKHVVVVVERECAACWRYAAELKSCALTTQRKLAFVSLSSARQTEVLKEKLPVQADLYLLKREEAGPELKNVTPVTLVGGFKVVGMKTCAELQTWLLKVGA
jgi:hypothetical protein